MSLRLRNRKVGKSKYRRGSEWSNSLNLWIESLILLAALMKSLCPTGAEKKGEFTYWGIWDGAASVGGKESGTMAKAIILATVRFAGLPSGLLQDKEGPRSPFHVE